MISEPHARVRPGDVWRIVKPYWRSSERRVGFVLLALLGIHVALDALSASLLSDVTKQFFDALQVKDHASFTHAAWISLAATLFVAAVFAAGRLLRAAIAFHWRRFQTRYYAARWFEDDAMYHLERKRLADNPDQRIAEDPALFTTAAIELVMSLVGVATQVAVYGTVLWHVELPPSSSLHNVPGSAVMAALAMGAGFSLAVHAIGRRLPKILAETQHVEADFRFALMQQREGAEQIAFLRGHSFEQSRLAELFGAVARNWRVSLAKGLQVEGAANLYAIGSTFIATLVLMPSVLSGTMSMGGLMQAQLAFTQVALAMSWLGDNFYAISDWLAATRRLTVLNRVLSRSPGRSIGFGQHDHPTIEITSLVVNRPDGLRLLALDRLSIHRGQRWLLQGKSGVGKSTLLRSLAGLWPEAEGTVVMPSGASIMFVPQRPYVAPGTLKEALCYPNPTHEVPDERCTSALVACGLAERVIDLHQHRRWSRVLSLGEQQQLMFARVGIAAPDFLFMDEATSAVDEATEGHCFEWLLRTLPATALVSVAHRESVARFHGDRLRVEPDGSCVIVPVVARGNSTDKVA